MPREASLRWVGAPRPAEEERGGWLGLATVRRLRKQGRKRWRHYWRTVKPEAQTQCTGEVPFTAAQTKGGWNGQDGSAAQCQQRMHAWAQIAQRAAVAVDSRGGNTCMVLSFSC
jgi:hypothetical protein